MPLCYRLFIVFIYEKQSKNLTNQVIKIPSLTFYCFLPMLSKYNWLLFVSLILFFSCDIDNHQQKNRDTRSKSNIAPSEQFNKNQLQQSSASMFDSDSQTLSLCLDVECRSNDGPTTISLDDINPKSVDLKIKFFADKNQLVFNSNEFTPVRFIIVYDFTDYNSAISSYNNFQANIDSFENQLPSSFIPDNYFQDYSIYPEELDQFRDFPTYYHMIYRDVDKTSNANGSNASDLSDFEPGQIVELDTNALNQDRSRAGYEMLKNLPSTIKDFRSKKTDDVYIENTIILFYADRLLENPQGSTEIGQDIVDAWNSLTNKHNIMFIAMYDQSDPDKKNQWKEFFTKIFPDYLGFDKDQKRSLPILEDDLSDFNIFAKAFRQFEDSMEFCFLFDVKTGSPIDNYLEEKFIESIESMEEYKSSNREDFVLIIDDILNEKDPKQILEDKTLEIRPFYCCISRRWWLDSANNKQPRETLECNSIANTVVNFNFE